MSRRQTRSSEIGGWSVRANSTSALAPTIALSCVTLRDTFVYLKSLDFLFFISIFLLHFVMFRLNHGLSAFRRINVFHWEIHLKTGI